MTKSASMSVTASPTAPELADGPGASASTRLAILGSLVVTFLAGSSAPTPLYGTYQAMWGFSAVTTTVVFGIYAVAVLLGLLYLGRLSDHMRRKPVHYIALGFQLVAMALLATANDVAMLLGARVVQGVSTGAAMAAVGAAMLDVDRLRGSVTNAVAPGTGTATGARASALMVVALPAPTHLIHITLAAVFAAQAVLLRLVPETASRRPGPFRAVRPTLTVPDEVRGRVLAAAPVLFAVWALAGFYGSLGPGLVSTLTGTESIVLGGTALFVLAGIAALAVFVLRRVTPPRVLMVGIGSLIAGVVVLLAGVHAGAPVAFFVGTAIAGVGFGSGFQGALRLVLPTVQPEDRAGTMSVLYIVSYLGMGVPAVGAAELVVHGSALVDAATAYGAVVVGLAALAAPGLTVPRLASRWRSANGSNPGSGWWRGALRVEPCADRPGRCDVAVPECRGGA
jgi:Major Facilitator Superfamily